MESVSRAVSNVTSLALALTTAEKAALAEYLKSL
jgi:hypothetical protein